MQHADRIVVHYAEIGLKSGNRGRFEKMLVDNMRHKLGARVGAIKRESGQITLTPDPAARLEEIVDIVKRVPGVAYLSPAMGVERTMEAIAAAARSLVDATKCRTFKIETLRRDKTYPIRSMDISRDIGARVLEGNPALKARMVDPDLAVRVELATDRAYVSSDRTPGPGGLPTDRSQKVVALVSGGLDSPVAAYLMMKRGCEVVLLHFQNQNQLTNSVADKVSRLAGQLSRYQIRTRLHTVPFEGLQDEIIKHVRAELRMLVYRRIMIRMAAPVADRYRAKFLVVGDSLSQVASQTYPNLAATYCDSSVQILTPLIGLDKEEIVKISREIETYDISSLPYEDCCSYFLPKHPKLRANVDELRDCESRFDMETLTRDALAAMTLTEWK